MKNKLLSILLILSMVVGLAGIAIIRKSPLNPVYDISLSLVLVGLIGLLIYTSIRWFKKSMIKKIFAGLFSLISLFILLIVVISIIDFRLLLPKSPSRHLTKAEWIEDFDVLSESIQTHPAYTDSIGLILDSYRFRLKNEPEVSDELALITSMKMTSLLNDAHSNVMPLQLYIKKPKYLPIQTHVFEDGIFITKARDKRLIGGRIESINRQPIESIYNQ